jgi:hypothetical protein
VPSRHWIVRQALCTQQERRNEDHAAEVRREQSRRQAYEQRQRERWKDGLTIKHRCKKCVSAPQAFIEYFFASSN